jgi:hypothetical protein
MQRLVFVGHFLIQFRRAIAGGAWSGNIESSRRFRLLSARAGAFRRAALPAVPRAYHRARDAPGWAWPRMRASVQIPGDPAPLPALLLWFPISCSFHSEGLAARLH